MPKLSAKSPARTGGPQNHGHVLDGAHNVSKKAEASFFDRQPVEGALFPPVPIVYIKFAICQPSQLTPEHFIFRPLLPHGLCKEIALGKMAKKAATHGLGVSHKSCAIIVECLVENRWQLRQIAAEEDDKPTKHLVKMLGMRLAQPLINTPQIKTAYHAFFINDDGSSCGKVVLELLQPFALERRLPATVRPLWSPLHVQAQQLMCSLASYKVLCRRVGESTHTNSGPVA